MNLVDKPMRIEVSHQSCQKSWWASCNTMFNGPFCARGKTKDEALGKMKMYMEGIGIPWPDKPKVEVTE